MKLACSLEGHPDNVAPAIYGGCQLGLFNGERWQSERVQLPPGIQVRWLRNITCSIFDLSPSTNVQYFPNPNPNPNPNPISLN